MRPRTAWIIGAVVVVLLVAVLATVFLGGGNDSGSTGTLGMAAGR
jgi:hypothetical protein